MSTTIERKEEYILTRSQFETLRDNGQLIVGASYTITDDPTVEDIITGEEIAKKAEKDASGNVITSTYRTVADSYTKAQVDALIPTKTSDFTNDGDGTDNNSPFATQAYVAANGGKIDSISVNNIAQTIDANKNVNITVPTQASDVHALPDNTKYATNISVSGTTVQLKDQDGNNIGSSITTQDTGATSIETTGAGNAVTSASYDASTRKVTLTKGETFLKTSEYNVDSALSTSSTNPVQNKVIAELIPNQASSSNQLADKSFVNSSISTATATFRGTYNLITDLSLTASATHAQIAAAIATKLTSLSIIPDNNDYCFIQIPTADATPTQITSIERYKFDGTNWEYEYTLNNSGFTASQWAAINSGVTDTLVTQISTNTSDITSLNSNKVDKTTTIATIDLQDNITKAELLTALNVEDGAQVNNIATISAGGAALTPDANKNVNIPIAGNSVKGVVDVRAFFGNEVDAYGRLATVKASAQEIEDKTNDYKAIVPSNLNSAVKAALSDANHLTMTSTEQATAQEVLGINLSEYSKRGIARFI